MIARTPSPAKLATAHPAGPTRPEEFRGGLYPGKQQFIITTTSYLIETPLLPPLPIPSESKKGGKESGRQEPGGKEKEKKPESIPHTNPRPTRPIQPKIKEKDIFEIKIHAKTLILQQWYGFVMYFEVKDELSIRQFLAGLGFLSVLDG